MCVVIDLDIVCLICLQPSKEMHPIFSTDMDNSELQIAQKISILSELKIDQHNRTLPSKICSKCLQDLKAAWRFRKNCQAAVTIFQTIVKLGDVQPHGEEEEEIVAPKVLEEQQIKVPQGLQIKRVNRTNLKGENLKAEETLIHEKEAEEDDDEFTLKNDKLDSTLYEELVTNDLVENLHNESNQFHNIEEETVETNVVQVQEEFENVENEDEESTVVEYYITDEGLINETDLKKDNKINAQEDVQQKPSQIKNTNFPIENRETKLTEDFVKPVQTRGRSRKQNVVTKSQTENVKVQETIKQIVVNKQNTGGKPLNKLEVRPVKTRKRKSLSPDAKPPKICEICGNSYRFQHALNAHMRRHYNEKPFPCDFCDKAFVSNVELRRHMRVHTGQKPYACQYCERRFSDFGSRIKHERTHTGERPYHCNTCGKSFAYPHVLSVHLRTHTGEKRFRCQYCSKGFTKKVYLNSHVEQHHSVASNNFQLVIEDSTDNSQNNQIESNTKSQTFSECIYTTEFVNDDDTPEEEYEDEEDDTQEQGEIIMLQPKMEDEDDIQEIVEVQPDEYTITVR